MARGGVSVFGLPRLGVWGVAVLNGWKAIAAYLGREERTAMRWANERGMPVHRVPGPGRGSIYAVPAEIDAWRAADRQRPADAGTVDLPSEARQPGLAVRRRGIIIGLIAAALLAMIVGMGLRARSAQTIPAEPVFTDPAAKALFLQASYDWNLRTKDSLKRAVAEYSQAIGRDPRVPAAYVGLANSYLLMREYGSMPDPEAYSRAEAAAQAAIALAPQSPQAHRVLAFVRFWRDRDPTTAAREFHRAIALKPDDPLTHHWFANTLGANGEYDAALREITIARDLDPTATSTISDRGFILYMAGHRAEGLMALRTLAAEQPDAMGPHRSLALIALHEGRIDDHLCEFATVARLRGDTQDLAAVARWQAAGPAIAKVEQAMLHDARTPIAGRTDWYRVAQIESLMARPIEAADALGRSCAERQADTIAVAGDPWISHALSRETIAQKCGAPTRMS